MKCNTRNFNGIKDLGGGGNLREINDLGGGMTIHTAPPLTLGYEKNDSNPNDLCLKFVARISDAAL